MKTIQIRRDDRTYRGHTAENRHENSDPCRSQNGFDGTNVVLRVSSVNSSEGESGGDDGDEHEGRDGHRLLVEIRHLGLPVSSNGGSQVGPQSSAPWLAFLDEDATTVRNQIIVINCPSGRALGLDFRDGVINSFGRHVVFFLFLVSEREVDASKWKFM